jgi:hypothetical protein
LSARSRISRTKVFSAVSDTTIALNVFGKAIASLLILKIAPSSGTNVAAKSQGVEIAPPLPGHPKVSWVVTQMKADPPLSFRMTTLIGRHSEGRDKSQ